MSTDALAHASPSQMVPGDFAEKAMASLMQLHSELMDEKERRVELFRKLMEREQVVAELRMYVRLLEEKLNPPKLDQPEPQPRPPPQPQAQPQAQQPAQPPPHRVVMHPQASFSADISAAPSAHVRAPEVAPPLPPRVARPRVDGWKTW